MTDKPKKKRTIHAGVAMKAVTCRLPADLVDQFAEVALAEDRSFVGQLAQAMKRAIADHKKKAG